ncbi:unnamed protein product [Paramecium pentaurelia]|uniref:Tetratricopeptide repeat protein n=1 Tax=Paramecium pentaurelia TaxID=43138 RepID=A0A8S1YPV0_9CILI|nr:unnamed protein product [Paramecium pentaurelia]
MEINKDFTMGYCRVGTIISDFKQQDNELQYFNQAIEKDGNCYYSFMCREISIKLQKSILNIVQPIITEASYITILEKKIKHYMTIIKQSNLIQMTTTYHTRGNFYQIIGEKEKAQIDYNKAIQFDPNNALTYYSRGKQNYTQYKMSFVLNYKGKALNDYDKAIQLDQNHAYTYYNRAILYQHTGECYKTLNGFNQALNINPIFVNAFQGKGLLLQDLQQYEEAIICIDKIISLNSNHIDAYFNKGFIQNIIQQILQNN